MTSKFLSIDKKIQERLKIVFFKNQKILIYNISNTYLNIPENIFIEKQPQGFTLFSTRRNDENNLKTFSSFILKFLLNANKVYKKLLRLKGLGFRTLLFKNRKRLRLKLGFSHLIKIRIPKNIKIFRNKKKNAISLISKDPIKLGNFCKIIKSFKTPNSYNGKGFSYNKENILLKSFKKK